MRKKFNLVCVIIAMGLSLSLTTGAETVNPVKNFGDDILLKPKNIFCLDGEIYVQERGEETILVFSYDGAFKTKIGKKGAGPGEFVYLSYLQVNKQHLYVYDPGQFRIHFLDRKKRKYLHSKTISQGFSLYNPTSFIVLPGGQFYFSTTGRFKDEFLIHKVTPDLRKELSFLAAKPIYSNVAESQAQKELIPKDFFNDGYLVGNEKVIYFAYYLFNKVISFSPEGKRLNEYDIPLPSMEKTAKVRIAGQGGALESRLNYDLKLKDNRLFLLSRTPEGQSVIFALEKNRMKEYCRMKEELRGFDIVGDRVYGLHEDEDGIYIYTVKK